MATAVHPSFALMPAAAAAAFLLGLPAARAQTAAPAATTTTAATAVELPPMAVSATRTPRPIDQLPATVTVIEDTELERRSAVSPRDAVRYEPGVSVGSQPTRTGATSYVIRGIGDNRVRLQIDGVKVPDFPSSNVGAGTYSRDYVDLESVKRIEIVRGPASALYGSDAIGGVVSYVTKDPGDYLGLVGKDWYASGKIGYSGLDSSISETGTAAARVGALDTLLQFTHRNGEEIRPNGSLKANPQDTATNSFLGKWIWNAGDADRLRLIGEYTERKVETDVVTDRGITAGVGGSPSTAVLSSLGRDETSRSRWSLDWVHDAPIGFVDRIEARGYWTRAFRREDTVQQRSSFVSGPPVPNRERFSDFRFIQNIYGADLQLDSGFSLLGAAHRLTWGGSLDWTETARPRDRTERNLTTGAVATTIGGESFPNKNFPDTGTLQAGVFAQDEITLGRLTVTPGLRVDYYELTPYPDRAFDTSSGGLTVKGLSEAAASPKLGAVYALTDVLSLFAGYAHGFRAPPYDTANFGFTNRQSGYQILPSANLRSETVDGVEAGVRGRFADGSSFALTGFHNSYSDFINSKQVGTAGGLQLFQYVNLSNVTIYGAEARGEWRVARDWWLRGSLAYARGTDDDTGAPIDSVDPLKLIGGLRYAHAAGWGGWGAELIATHAFRHDRVSTATYFRAPGYTTLDATAYVELQPTLTLNAGIFNVTDAKYFNSQDVIGLAATSSTRDLYAQPGRYAGANVTLRW